MFLSQRLLVIIFADLNRRVVFIEKFELTFLCWSKILKNVMKTG